jgi:hypothetical protein
MGYYDYRVFGNVFTPPYKVNRESYASAPHFLWQTARPEPMYRHRILRDFYSGGELKEFRDETRSVAGLLEAGALKPLAAGFFYLDFALIPPLILLPWALRDRRIVFLSLAGAVLVAGLAVETFFFPHYIAPATALIYAILLQCMRHLRVWRPSGLFLVRAIPVLCVALAVLRVCAGPLHIGLGTWSQSWYGTAPLGLERARVLAQLDSLPGPQLAIVRYSPNHMLNDWVYNAADIDKSKVVWARQMDTASDRELLNYYQGRQAWLVEPDCNPPRVSPFPGVQEPAGLAQVLVPAHSPESQ